MFFHSYVTKASISDPTWRQTESTEEEKKRWLYTHNILVV